jgi:uncharacterized membrane protein
MTYSAVLILHICGAAIGLLSGSAALFFRKGSRLHRTTGNAFFISMLIMSASAAYLALMKQQLINAIVGVLTFYLVTTGWATIIRKEGHTGLFEFGALLVALADGTAGLILGWQATNSTTGIKDGYPAAAYFVFGSVALFAAALDARIGRSHVDSRRCFWCTTYHATSLAYVFCILDYSPLFFPWKAAIVSRGNSQNTSQSCAHHYCRRINGLLADSRERPRMERSRSAQRESGRLWPQRSGSVALGTDLIRMQSLFDPSRRKNRV